MTTSERDEAISDETRRIRVANKITAAGSVFHRHLDEAATRLAEAITRADHEAVSSLTTEEVLARPLRRALVDHGLQRTFMVQPSLSNIEDDASRWAHRMTFRHRPEEVLAEGARVLEWLRDQVITCSRWAGRVLIPEVESVEIGVDQIEWHDGETVTVVECRECRATGAWTLWTRPDRNDNPDAGAVCGTCGLDQGHPLVYPDYVRARAARITDGTDTDEPRLETTIGWRPHFRDSVDVDWDSTAIARVTWRPMPATNSLTP